MNLMGRAFIRPNKESPSDTIDLIEIHKMGLGGNLSDRVLNIM